ncbi:hypothetical protein AJ80_05386 [Polytolypa hystricis UAMH7299]|uniref:Uncharacterized protein n=1 Tax=Polytolypa hystricis (strain UAMH7299) TaxID=1447883 RepID=A0A2B7Y3R7_POLH7|nr:hypothetical protein AJ80_05386 [Polytolypa hystricis UAMH7299]
MASHTQPSPLPHTTILSSTRISQSAAHDFLSAYLERAASDPGLQPDAALSGHGPVSANTGSAPNLVIHNLKRVQAGLAGEVLGRDLTFAKLSGDGASGEVGGVFQLQSHKGGDGENWGGQRTGDNDGWQDLQTYEREQQVDEVAGDDEAGIGETVGEPMEVDEDGMPPKISKEERKQKKKERRKAEKRAKAQG